MAEQLRRNQRRRNRPTVHSNESASGAPGSIMNSARDELFSCAGFTEYQHSGICGRHFANLRNHCAQGLRRSDDFCVHRRTIDFLAQRQVFVAYPLFRPLAVLDVGSCRVPTKNASLFVVQGVVADEKPAVFSIFAQCSLLTLERQSAGQRVPTLMLPVYDILGVEEPAMKIVRHDLLCAHSRIIKQPFIDVENISVRVQDGNGLWNDIDNLSQFSFGFLNLLKRQRQREFGSIALDGNSGDPAGVVDQLNFGWARLSNFTVKHTESAQYFAVMGNDWRRPGG